MNIKNSFLICLFVSSFAIQAGQDQSNPCVDQNIYFAIGTSAGVGGLLFAKGMSAAVDPKATRHQLYRAKIDVISGMGFMALAGLITVMEYITPKC